MKKSSENCLSADKKDNPIALLGIGGGIAAYKAIQIASKLFQSGLETHVAMTRYYPDILVGIIKLTHFVQISRRIAIVYYD